MARIESDISIKESTLVTIAAKLIGLLLTAYVLYRIYKKIVGEVQYPDTEYVTGGGDVTTVFISKSLPGYISELHDVLTTSYYLDASPRCRAYERLEKLNDNQIIHVANEYKNQFKQTIRQSMSSTYMDACSIGRKQYDKYLLSRFDRLNIP